MLLVISGEGSSDMGGIYGEDFRPGPMAAIVDQLMSAELGCSHIQNERVKIVSRGELSRISKERRRASMALPGAKVRKGYMGYSMHSWALAIFCKDMERRESDCCLGVMFRDSDGTKSDDANRWECIVEAMEIGFKSADFTAGVVMVPKPKQEAWLLCAKKIDCYQSCEALENESGNDASPNSLKRKFAAACGGSEPSVDEMVGWVVDGVIDLRRIDMPSFLYFRRSLDAALRGITAKGNRGD